MRRIPVLVGAGAALLATTPAMAADVQIRALDAPGWDKPEVQVTTGDTVTWSFEGTTLAHNVQSASDNWAFSSPIGVPAPTFTSPPFTASGRYTFVCQLHQDSMRGTVIVGDPPPPPLSEQPFLNDSGEPAVVETGAYDGVRPVLTEVTVRRAQPGVRVAFRVSESSRVTARFLRGGRAVRTIGVRASGRAAITARTGLRSGGYRIELRAQDAAGNRSRVRHLRVTLR